MNSFCGRVHVTVCFAILAVVRMASAQCDIFVPEDYSTIQGAIDAASHGQVICVAPGTYQERGIDLLGKSITLQSTDGAAATIIDGAGSGPILLCISGESPSSVIDGFTIQNGDARAGAGMRIEGSSPTVRNCIFSEGTGFDGGGILITQSSRPRIEGCRFEHNTVTDEGGALWIGYGSHVEVVTCVFEQNSVPNGSFLESGGAIATSSDSTVTCSDCTFISNYALDAGGAAHVTGDAQFVRCMFASNSSAVGGAIYDTGSGTVSFTDCAFQDNTAGLEIGGTGGAIHSVGGRLELETVEFLENRAYDGAAIFTDSSIIDATMCAFDSNAAPHRGGAVFTTKSDAQYRGCVFDSNSAGEWCGGVFSTTSCDSGYEDCVFQSNTASEGAAAYAFDGCTSTFSDCTFASNSARFGGGAVRIADSDASLAHCLFEANDGKTGGAVLVEGSGSLEVMRCHFESNEADGARDSCGGSGRPCGGGAIWLGHETTHVIDSSVFLQNHAVDSGGALFIRDASPVIVDCDFGANSADQRGAAIFYENAHASILRTRFRQNSTSNNGGAVYVWAQSDVDIEDCDFETNVAEDRGGAMFVEDAVVRILTSRFCENTPQHIWGPWTDLGHNHFSDDCSSCLALDVENLKADEYAVFTVSNGTPGESCMVVWGVKDGERQFGNGGWCVGFGFDIPLSSGMKRVLVQGPFDSDGVFRRSKIIKPGTTGINVRFQAAMKNTCPDTCMSNIWMGIIE